MPSPDDKTDAPQESEVMQRLNALAAEYNAKAGAAAESLKQRYFAAGMQAPAQELAALASLLDGYAKAFSELDGPAKALDEAGKSAVLKLLTAYEEDARKAAETYTAIITSATAAEGERAAIMKSASDYVTSTIQSVNQIQAKAYEAANAAWWKSKE